jgi:hypothetical protein
MHCKIMRCLLNNTIKPIRASLNTAVIYCTTMSCSLYNKKLFNKKLWSRCVLCSYRTQNTTRSHSSTEHMTERTLTTNEADPRKWRQTKSSIRHVRNPQYVWKSWPILGATVNAERPLNVTQKLAHSSLNHNHVTSRDPSPWCQLLSTFRTIIFTALLLASICTGAYTDFV